MPPIPEADDSNGWYARPVAEFLSAYAVDPDRGLSARQVHKRRARHGANSLRQSRRRHPLRILLAQLASVVILVLAAAAGLAFVLGHWAEGTAVLAVVSVNVGIGFVSEWRALRSMDALWPLRRRVTRVRRNGRGRDIAVEQLLPGDGVLLDGGDLVPADLRVVASEGLCVSEAVLTGGSVSVDKRPEPVAPGAPLTDRQSMPFPDPGVRQVVVRPESAGPSVGTGHERGHPQPLDLGCDGAARCCS